jgi:prophage regulatory protein
MKKRAVTKSELADERILSTAELLERIPLTRQSLWRMAREGRFPRPIRLTKSKIGWKWSAVLAWLAEREDRPLDRRPYFPTDKTPLEADVADR